MMKYLFGKIFGNKGGAGKREIRLSLHLKEKPHRVVVAGNFNDWSCFQNPLHFSSSGAWETTLRLAPGTYQYRFLVDNSTWKLDPLADTALNEYGGISSVLVVKQFEAALARESAAVGQEQYA